MLAVTGRVERVITVVHFLPSAELQCYQDLSVAKRMCCARQASLPIRSLDAPIPSHSYKAGAEDAEDILGETLDGAAVEGGQQVRPCSGSAVCQLADAGG